MDFLSFLIEMTPLRIIGSEAANNTMTNSFGISDTAASAEISELEVKIIWKIIVGINHTHNPKINQ